MSFSNGQTGVERGAVQLLFTKTPKILSRNREGGPDRVVAFGLPGDPILCEYACSQDRRKLVLRSEVLTAAQVATLRTLLDEAGPVEVKSDPSGTASLTAVFAPDQVLEPIFGDYPESAPDRLTRWRAVLTFFLLE